MAHTLSRAKRVGVSIDESLFIAMEARRGEIARSYFVEDAIASKLGVEPVDRPRRHAPGVKDGARDDELIERDDLRD